MTSEKENGLRVSIAKAVAVILIAIVMCALSVFVPLPRQYFLKEPVHSLRVLDRNGILLREYLNDQEGRGHWTGLAHVALPAQLATIAVEDRRFYAHPGVDLRAIGRALIENAKAGKSVSGGSTITQQVVRNVFHQPRTLFGKLVEAWYALRLERMMTKGEILEQYLNRAPYGNQLTGIESASRQYFGKPSSDLSIAESAFLAALPNSPSFLNPYRNREATVLRQKTVLKRMLDQGRIQREEYDRALVQPLSVLPSGSDFRAPHAVEMIVSRVGNRDELDSIRTTIDIVLQQQIESIVRGHLAKLAKRNVTNAAVVVIENSSGEIRALVGSADYFDDVHNGQVNGALALRQPGSSMKPFTYGVAFEAGCSPADIIPDIPIHIPDDRGDYIPENYDRKYHGPVRVRTALACSYNIPAVRILQAVGKENLLYHLHSAGFTSLTQPAAYYGYGLTLGNGEVTLLELTNAYAALSRGGMWKPATIIRSLRSVDGIEYPDETSLIQLPHRVYDERASFLLTSILSDPVARRAAFGNSFNFPFACAVKTGTTKDYRDNWTVGYTTAYTVGVWAGNFDGTPMRSVSGITGAGQIFADVMVLLHMAPFGATPGEFVVPPGLVQRAVCSVSGKLPTENCGRSIQEWFFKERAPEERCEVHQRYRIERPDGSVRDQVFEVFASEYNQWREEQQIASPPAGATRVALPMVLSPPALGVNQHLLAIVSPNSGDVFRIDPVLRAEYQAIKIVARIPGEVTDVKLLIDNVQESSYAGTGVWWQLRKGSHHFQLTGMRNNKRVFSEPVMVHIE